jgi:hypothetical protein
MNAVIRERPDTSLIAFDRLVETADRYFKNIPESLQARSAHNPSESETRHLAQYIYTSFYCGLGYDDVAVSTPEREVHIRRMTASDALDGGWVIISTTGDTYVAEKDGWIAQFSREDFIFDQRTDLGTKISVRASTAIHDPVTGNYSITYRLFGRAWTAREVRFYVNIHPAGVETFYSNLFLSLASLTIPFKMKFSAQWKGYERRDSFVLYLDQRHASLAYPTILLCVKRSKAVRLRGLPFSLMLRDGFSFAESPRGDQSFGQFISEMSATGVAKFADASPKGRPQQLIEHFAKEGIRLGKEFRRPNAAYPYSFIRDVQ